MHAVCNLKSYFTHAFNVNFGHEASFCASKNAMLPPISRTCVLSLNVCCMQQVMRATRLRHQMRSFRPNLLDEANPGSAEDAQAAGEESSSSSVEVHASIL